MLYKVVLTFESVDEIMARHTSQNSNIFKNAMPVLYLYSMFLFPFFYTFLYSWFIFYIPGIFFIFLIYFLYSFHIFYIPAIFFIFLLYFSYSFYIFYIPSIFIIFVLISIQHVTDMDHDAPVLHFRHFGLKKDDRRKRFERW